MKLSYSEISTYQNCPLQYRLKYIEKREVPPSASLSFGKSVHSALEWLYSPPTPHPPSLDQLIEHLDACWISEGYASADEEARYFYQARSALELYYRKNVQAPAEDFMIPAALEFKFRIDIGICELSGVIDRLDKLPSGGFRIIDYKTNRRLPPARRLAEDLQLPLYQVAAERIWDIEVESVCFYYVLLDHCHSIHVTPERISAALGEVELVSRSIEAGDFSPVRNNLCPWCDFLEECPLMAGKVQSRRGALVAPHLEIGQAVDELVLTHLQVSQKLSRVEGLKGIVASYLSEKGVSRVSGSVGTAFIDGDGHLSWGESEES